MHEPGAVHSSLGDALVIDIPAFLRRIPQEKYPQDQDKQLRPDMAAAEAASKSAAGKLPPAAGIRRSYLSQSSPSGRGHSERHSPTMLPPSQLPADPAPEVQQLPPTDLPVSSLSPGEVSTHGSDRLLDQTRGKRLKRTEQSASMSRVHGFEPSSASGPERQLAEGSANGPAFQGPFMSALGSWRQDQSAWAAATGICCKADSETLAHAPCQ